MLATYRQDPRKNVDVAGKGYKAGQCPQPNRSLKLVRKFIENRCLIFLLFLTEIKI
jgi:hypothetical protein